MSRNWFLQPAASVLVLSAAALASAQTAWAEGREVDLDLSEANGYGRIVASWADGSENGPAVVARMTGPVLIMTFDEPVSLDLDALKDGLPSYVAIARQSDDGREIRIALARKYRVHKSQSLDLTAIDLLPEDMTSDPADIVSPLAEVKRQQADAAAAAAEARRLANIPPPLNVDVHGSETDAFSTLAFYWPETIGFTSEPTEHGIRIEFARRGIADFSRVRVDGPTGLKSINGENTDETFVVTIDLEDGYWGNPVSVDNAVIVRVRKGERPEELPADDPLIPDALQALAETLPDPEPDGIKPPSRKPYDSSPLLVSEIEDAHEEPPLPEATPVLSAALTAEDPRLAELPPITPARVWREALPRTGKVPVRVEPNNRGVDVQLTFVADIPGVIFRRHDAIWLAFPANGEFDLSSVSSTSGLRVDQIQSDSGMALRLFVPRDLIVKIKSSGRNWSISAGSEGELADRQINPKRIASQGGSGVEAVVHEAGSVFQLTDPDIGDELIFVPASDPSTSLVQSLSFVDAEFPATTHGLVIIPRADDVTVVQRQDLIRIGRDAGLALSSWGVESEVTDRSGLSPGFMDFAAWRRGDESAYWRNQSRLAAEAAGADPEDWAGQSALLNLARFYLAWEYAAEAYGPLNIAASADPLLEQDAQWRTLKAAADVMNGRYDDAIKGLDHGSVRGDAAASAWLGLAYAEIGEWRKAREAFLLAETMIDAHEPTWAARFHAAAARAMIRMGDGARAETHALSALRIEDPEAIGQANLTLGELAVATGRLDDASAIFQRLRDNPNPNVRVRAELESIKLAVQTGQMSNLDASDRLDTLRFRWRGDQLELEIVAELADAYFELGRYREALTLAQSFAEQFPNLPGSRELRLKLSEQFNKLFLDGKADTLDPISALALYYEFKDLTPVGPDGDRMIRLLANRLVAFDLLDPATELLAHQVEQRNLIGQSRAQIAADLATIYLLDKRPEKALLTLNTTREIGLPDELRLERRLLEAAAHMELKRYGHAIELLQPLDDPRAKELLAEVHWRARTWGAAGRALQSTLPEPGGAFSSNQLRTAVRSAVAYRLDGDYDGLANLRTKYLTQLKQTDEGDTFDLLTGTTEVSASRLTDTVRRLADTTTANAFLASLKQKFDGAGGSL